MPDETLFIGVAQQQGFPPAAARRTLAAVAEQLRARGGPAAASFYIYRTGPSGAEAPADPPAGAERRPRTLLAFRTPDSAFVFAQQEGLGASPRLLSLSLPQLLAVLVQRPTIGAVVIADDIDDLPATRTLPPGLRLERTSLLELLAKD